MEVRGAFSRHDARQCALQVLYAIEVGRQEPKAVFDDLVHKGQDRHLAFARRLVSLAHKNRQAMDDHIAARAEHWDLDRIALLDRLILRLALCELLYVEDVPPKVSINEAIDLAKAFSTDQSGRFVNGILDAFFNDHEAEILRVKTTEANAGRARKKGRAARGGGKEETGEVKRSKPKPGPGSG